jgi:hypothetical protein
MLRNATTPRWPLLGYFRYRGAVAAYTELPATEVTLIDSNLLVSNATTIFESHGLGNNFRLEQDGDTTLVGLVLCSGDRFYRFKLHLEASNAAELLCAVKTAASLTSSSVVLDLALGLADPVRTHPFLLVSSILARLWIHALFFLL